MKYLLDTAAWLNGITIPEALPERIRRILKSEETKALCSISLLESAILYRLGRLDYEGSLHEIFAAGLSTDIRVLELNASIAAKTNELSRHFSGDPFDRTIISTAVVLNLTIITADPAIRDEGFCTVEYYPFKPARRVRSRRRADGSA